jgi:hypothetical protein
MQASGFKALGILCCKSNPITAKFWLDRCGYVPGEKIIFNAEVENLTRKTMRGSKVQIIEVKEKNSPNVYLWTYTVHVKNNVSTLSLEN